MGLLRIILGKRRARNVELFLIRNRRKIKDSKLAILGGLGILSYVFGVHYRLVAPLVCVLIFIEVMRKKQ